MAIIPTSDVILQARLTRVGRRLRLMNNARFIFAKFALGDREIPYDLIKDNQVDQPDIENLSVFEPNTNPQEELGSLLIRKLDNLETLALNKSASLVPTNEFQLKTQIIGNTVFSLQNWKTDEATISFSILDPGTQSYFLSNGFIVDLTDFYNSFQINDNKDGVAFSVNPIFPSTTLGRLNSYWYNIGDAIDKNGNALATQIGIDDAHKGVGVPLVNLSNTLNIPLLTFQVKLLESQVKDIYNYLLSSKLSSITGKIVISNNDQNVVPLTTFYGPTKSYSNIHTSLNFTVTF